MFHRVALLLVASLLAGCWLNRGPNPQCLAAPTAMFGDSLLAALADSVHRHASPRTVTELRATLLFEYVWKYEFAYGRPPNSLAEALTVPPDLPGMELTDAEIVDGWDREFNYGIQGTRVELRSSGGDGIPYSDDDIVYVVEIC